jgi:integrase
MRGIISPLAGLRFHDLRHSAATKMLENGVPIATVAQVLGWSASTAVRMAKRYGHIRPEAQRQALESIATACQNPGQAFGKWEILGQWHPKFRPKHTMSFS